MKKSLNRAFILFLGSFFAFALIAPGVFGSQSGIQPDEEPLASKSIGTRGISFKPKVRYAGMVLSVSKPDGTVFQKTFEGRSTPYFELSSDCIDGSYTYELRMIPELERRQRREIDGKKSRFSLQTKGIEEELRSMKAAVQTGYFRVLGGRIVTGGGDEHSDTAPEGFTIQDIVHADDVIINGNLGVGFGAVNGETFGHDVLRLKDSVIRIGYVDTSTEGYPSNDWRILINGISLSGGNYYSIQDDSSGHIPFTIEAEGPSHSLYVDDFGRVGMGTSIPTTELHISDGDSPTILLDQNATGGWPEQKWTVGGNEVNFFVKDTTSITKEPFRIGANTPSNTLCLKSSGKVGIGTWTPEQNLEIEDTGENVILLLDRTDGAKTGFSASGDKCAFGTLTNHPLWMVINGAFNTIFHTDGSLQMMNGAWCTAAGVWQDASSREYKENIQDLSTEEAMDALEGLNPVKYNYKKEKDDGYVGFIAEDVPELVASKDRKTMSPMDVVGVLTKVVQEQQKTISELQMRIEMLEKDSQTKK